VAGLPGKEGNRRSGRAGSSSILRGGADRYSSNLFLDPPPIQGFGHSDASLRERLQSPRVQHRTWSRFRGSVQERKQHWPGWIRTTTAGSKDRCPAIRRRARKETPPSGIVPNHPPNVQPPASPKGPGGNRPGSGEDKPGAGESVLKVIPCRGGRVFIPEEPEHSGTAPRKKRDEGTAL
jgi:hypothetical protein